MRRATLEHKTIAVSERLSSTRKGLINFRWGEMLHRAMAKPALRMYYLINDNLCDPTPSPPIKSFPIKSP